jgi:ubiquinone/menaquinone biosynthesis C-methylase UbiE
MIKILKLERLEEETAKYSALDICEGMLIYKKKKIKK